MVWSPAVGTRDLVDRVGHARALEVLARLLSGDTSGRALTMSGAREALLDIGDGHAARLMADPTGSRLAYWPRVWAARSMAYLGDQAAAPFLIDAIHDDHWRVRMIATQALGRLGVEGITEELIGGLDDEHRRVRAAAVVALGRVGSDDARERLVRELDIDDDDSFRRVDRAIRDIEQRRYH